MVKAPVRGDARVGSEEISSNDGAKTTEQNVTGTDAAEMVIYPNPVQSIFTARITGFESNEQLNVQLVSLNGASLKKMQARANTGNTEIKMDISSFPAGQYVLTVVGESKKVSQRVVKVSAK